MRLDGKRVYEGNEFESEQFNHRSSTKTKLQEVHSDIVSTMRTTFKVIGNWISNGPILHLHVSACMRIDFFVHFRCLILSLSLSLSLFLPSGISQ